MDRKNCPQCGSPLEDTDPGSEVVVFYCQHCNKYTVKEDLG